MSNEKCPTCGQDKDHTSEFMRIMKNSSDELDRTKKNTIIEFKNYIDAVILAYVDKLDERLKNAEND